MRVRAAALIALVVAALTGCSSTSAEETVSDPNAPLVAFYGDSYTLGTGLADLGDRWSTAICADRGWREFNPSVNGLGFVNNRASQNLPEQIVAQDPDIVFVTMGLNDNFSYDFAPDEIKSQITIDLAYLTGELPDARVIVVEPFWYTDERPESVEVIIDWVHEAADAIGADWIPDASHWIEGHPEWMASDGLHPNEDGYAEMTRRMDAALAQLGL
jgi:lysophospholipase L1-like esterase